MPVYNPTETDKIRNIVTLATPHVALPYAFDESIHQVYRDMEPSSSLKRSDVILTSISGGLKDELIPPTVCTKGGVFRSAGSTYGMDHKAITWCHQVLDKVRTILFILSREEGRAADEQVDTLVSSSFEEHAHQIARYKDQKGYLSYVALQSAMIYNVELLVAMYALSCGFYLIAPASHPLLVVVAVAALSTTLSNHGLSVMATLLLSFLASSIVLVLRLGLERLPSRSKTQSIQSRVYAAVVSFTATLGILLAVELLAKRAIGRSSEVHIPSTLIIALTLWVWLQPLFIKKSDQRNVVFAALISVTVPVLTLGKMYLFVWNCFGEYGDLDVSFAVKILSPIAMRFIVVVAKQDERAIFATVHVLAMYFCAFGMLQVGGGYLVGYYVAAVSVIETCRLVSSV